MSTADSEWYGEPHTLTVHKVCPHEGPLDDGSHGNYELKHPPSCEQEEHHLGYTRYTCAVADQEEDCGLAWSLRYSGTPITEPGTYRIQAWGRKSRTQLGWEYDGGVGVMGADGQVPHERAHANGQLARAARHRPR